MMAYVNEGLGKDAASIVSTIPLSNDTITTRQDKLPKLVEEKMVDCAKD